MPVPPVPNEMAHDHVIAVLLGILTVLLGTVITMLITGYNLLVNKTVATHTEVKGMKAHIHNFMVSQFLLMQKLHPQQASFVAQAMSTWLAAETKPTNGEVKGGERFV